MAALLLLFKGLVVGAPVLMLLATLIICFRDLSKSSPIRALEHPISPRAAPHKLSPIEESSTP
jgi:hypothetical protein